LPRKRGLPIIGNLHQMNLGRPELTFTEWGKELGDVFSVEIPGDTALVLNSFDAIHEALVTKGICFGGRPQENKFRLEFISDGFKDIFFDNAGARWKILRKTAHRQVKMFDAGSKQIEQLNLNVIKELAKEFRSHDGVSFNPRETIYHTIMNLTTMLLTNKMFKQTDEEFKLFTEIERLSVSSIAASGKGVELDLLPWLRFFGNSTYKKLLRAKYCRDVLWKMIKGEILEDIRSDDKEIDSLVHALFRLHQSQQEGNSPGTFPLEEANLRATFADMIVGATTTTSHSFYAFLNIISQHRDIQEKLQEEVDRVIGSDRYVSVNDRTTMPYTQAAVLELLRSTSVVPMAIPHVTLEKTSVSGYPIPPGVITLPNLWAMHHAQDFWGDPHAFRPERFLDDAGDLVSASHENRRHLMPFGAGTRVCLGENLAIGRLFLLIATVAQLFVVE
ncbi:hypothetical protein CAPTEDRAFT_73286, partial [Capitella teleta]